MAPKSNKKNVQIKDSKTDKKDDKKKIIGKGLEVKDNPDKIDKKDFDSNEEEEIDEDEIEDEESEVEESEVEEAEETEEKEKGDEDEEVQGGDDECVYKITKKKKILDIELDAVVEDTFEDEEPITNDIKYVKSEDRITKSYLYEFERVRLLGERAKQISMGAKPMIKNVDKLDPKSIARLEIENKVIPLMILRELPDGRIEKWKINELQ
jgi:DNA-directed RNA polymerase I, II, and III subunit RPABC2